MADSRQCRGALAQGHFLHPAGNNNCIDFLRWPLYCSASLPEAKASEICAARGARYHEWPWVSGAHLGMSHLCRATDQTPMDVPLHAGAELWSREHDLI